MNNIAVSVLAAVLATLLTVALLVACRQTHAQCRDFLERVEPAVVRVVAAQLGAPAAAATQAALDSAEAVLASAPPNSTCVDDVCCAER